MPRSWNLAGRRAEPRSTLPITLIPRRHAEPIPVGDDLAGSDRQQTTQALAAVEARLAAIDEAELFVQREDRHVGDGLRVALDPYGRR
jgi:hypothetical protein